MAISLDKAFGIHETALKLRAERTQMLANNIANADTPGYKARDIDFSAVLKNSSDNRQSGKLQTTHSNHISTNKNSITGDMQMYRVPNQAALDGNTVEMHVEQAEFSRNAVEYQASLKFLSGTIKGLMMAIKGE